MSMNEFEQLFEEWKGKKEKNGQVKGTILHSWSIRTIHEIRQAQTIAPTVKPEVDGKKRVLYYDETPGYQILAIAEEHPPEVEQDDEPTKQQSIDPHEERITAIEEKISTIAAMQEEIEKLKEFADAARQPPLQPQIDPPETSQV